MKKLLLILPIGVLMLSACGPNDEEKAKIQQEYQEKVDRKVNEIMEKLEPNNQVTNEVSLDSINSADSLKAEN